MFYGLIFFFKSSSSFSRPTSEICWALEITPLLGEWAQFGMRSWPQSASVEMLLGEILASKRSSSLLGAVGVSTCYLHILLGCFLLPMIVRNDIPRGIQVDTATMQIEVWPVSIRFLRLMLPLNNASSFQNWTVFFFSRKLARCLLLILNTFGLSSLES